MKNQKIFSSLLVMSMVTSACSSSSNGPADHATVSTQEEISKIGASQERWVQLTSTGHPNYALAEMLAPWLWQLNPDELNKVKQKSAILSEDAALNADLQKQLQSMKLAIILGRDSYIKDEDLLNLAVFSQVTQLESQGAFSLQIRLQTAAEAQARAYLKVQNAFNEKLKQNAKDIGADVVAKLDQEAINKINNVKNKDPKLAVHEIYQILQKWDKTLADYDFSAEDAHKIVLYGYIAAELYDYLKDHPSVKEFAQTVEKVRDFNNKVKEVRLVLSAMDKYRDNLFNGLTQMQTAMERIQEDINTNPDFAVDIEKPFTEQTKKDAVRAVTDLILGPSNVGNGDGKHSVLSNPHPMNQNVKDFFDGAAKTAGSVDGLIAGTRNVADSLGIALDPKIENALNTAQKISDGVKIAEQVASAFSSGGLVGAFGALAGSGGASVIMGPAGLGMAAMAQAQMNAELGKINLKLDEVITLQKKVLELQKQTLAKLDELSHKLDEYHNQEMLAIAGVKDEVLQNRRGVLNLIDDKLYSCTTLVNRIRSITDRKIASLNAINAGAVREEIAKSIKDDVTRTALQKEDVTKTSFAACSLAMMDAFSGKDIPKTPLSAVLSANEKEATPFEIKTVFFEPALKELTATYKNKGVANMALHLPSAGFVGLTRKSIYWQRSVVMPEKSLNADLSDLISIDALERYAGVLLSLHPILSISTGAWRSIPEVIESSWNGNTPWNQKQNLSEFWLKSALTNVNIAISQQALLAGEPILPQLVEKMVEIASEPSDCSQVKSKYCFVRQNTVMAKNLLKYHLFRRSGDPSFMAAYTQAFLDKSVPEMEKILGVTFEGRIAAPPNLNLVWQSETNETVDFPTPEEVSKGIISYPLEMARLVKLQEKIADELTKVSPNDLPKREQQLLTELILYKGH